MTIEFTPRGETTEASVTHDLLPDQQSADDHTKGWTSTLDSLARHFA